MIQIKSRQCERVVAGFASHNTLTLTTFDLPCQKIAHRQTVNKTLYATWNNYAILH